MTRDAPSEGRGLIPRTPSAPWRFVAEVKGQVKVKVKVKRQVKGRGGVEAFKLLIIVS